MKYAIFKNAKDLWGFCHAIQDACDKARKFGDPKIIISPFQIPDGDWAVPLPGSSRLVKGIVKDEMDLYPPPESHTLDELQGTDTAKVGEI